MRTDNSSHIAAAAKHRHEVTRAKAIAALRELDRAGTPISVKTVADRAGVSRSWLYTQPDLKDEITRLRAEHRPSGQAPPARQRADESSLRRRLDLALHRNRELADENQRLRRQLAHALGQARDNTHAPPARHHDSITNQPR
jgi:AraC-like DNA-binding protein